MPSFVKTSLLLVIMSLLLSCATLTVPVSATSNDVGRLVGTSTGTIWFGIFGKADASIKEACRDGGIREISTVDMQTQVLFLGLGKRYTCIVTGE
ncbi:MAG: TRL domain-containing protein [Spirochaetales bacterium]|nr:TRL domain-containing protein [Spirochaetales bacterium]